MKQLICKKCNVPLAIGQAIHPHENVIGYQRVMDSSVVCNVDTLKLIRCYKCPECGQSEIFDFFEESVQHYNDPCYKCRHRHTELGDKFQTKNDEFATCEQCYHYIMRRV